MTSCNGHGQTADL